MTCARAQSRLAAALIALAVGCRAAPPPAAPKVPAPDSLPGSPGAGDVLAEVRAEFAPHAALLDAFPPGSWSRLRDRCAEGSPPVAEAERDAFEADRAEVRSRCRDFGDPWWAAARERLEGVRTDPRFAAFGPVDSLPAPPWLVLAQREPDPTRHQTVNVLRNHARFLTAHRVAFEALLEEAGVPPPGETGPPPPLLTLFLFPHRTHFDAWNRARGLGPADIRALRTRITEPPAPVLLAYDTGAPEPGQDEGLGAVAFMATRWLLVERARRATSPGAPAPEGSGPPEFRVPGPWWLAEGLGRLFEAADRVSSVSGEWRFLRPHDRFLGEHSHLLLGKAPARWPLPEILDARAVDGMASGRTGDPGEFSARAWALAHFLYHGKGGAYRPRLLRMIRETLEGRGDPEIFHRAMETGDGETRARNLAALDGEIHAHVRDLLRRPR
jgi:hypothetical protein